MTEMASKVSGKGPAMKTVISGEKVQLRSHIGHSSSKSLPRAGDSLYQENIGSQTIG